MLEKLNHASVSAYVRVSSFLRKLKEDERGVDGIVIAVLLILVAVMLIVMFNKSLQDFLGGLWDRITGGGDTIQDADGTKGFGQ